MRSKAKSTGKIILAIDPGAISGWAILDSEIGFIDSGFGSPFKIANDVVGSFIRHSRGIVEGESFKESRSDMLLGSREEKIVIEKWTAGGWKSHKTLIGMGKNLAPWEWAIKNYKIPARSIVRTYPQTWRSKIFGRGISNILDQKSRAILIAQNLVEHKKNIHDHNEADAICIARWAQFQEPLIVKK